MVLTVVTILKVTKDNNKIYLNNKETPFYFKVYFILSKMTINNKTHFKINPYLSVYFVINHCLVLLTMSKLSK